LDKEWDGDDIQDQISIARGDCKQQMELPKGRKAVAIPQPSSRYGEISLLQTDLSGHILCPIW
jgi:hypothetical protein